VSTDANKEKSSSEESNNEKSSSEEEIRRGPQAPSTFDTQVPAEADKVAECAYLAMRRRLNGTDLKRLEHKTTEGR
jgi:hypothetical protein